MLTVLVPLRRPSGGEVTSQTKREGQVSVYTGTGQWQVAGLGKGFVWPRNKKALRCNK
jgi:hypothetical protein